MPKLIDQPTASESVADESASANLIHRLTSAWGGVPGECGVACECGVTYDGFDTIAEAEKLLTEQHIEKAVDIEHPEWCDTERCWAYAPGTDGETEAGGFHESAPIVVDTLNEPGIALHLSLDHGKSGAAPEVILCAGEPDGVECRHLTLDQVGQLYAALQVLVPGLTNGNTARSTFELGEKNGRRTERRAHEMPVNGQFVSDDTLAALERIQKRFDDAERETYRAYCNGYVDALDSVAPAFGVTR